MQGVFPLTYSVPRIRPRFIMTLHPLEIWFTLYYKPTILWTSPSAVSSEYWCQAIQQSVDLNNYHNILLGPVGFQSPSPALVHKTVTWVNDYDLFNDYDWLNECAF